MGSPHLLHFTDDNFDAQVLASPEPVLVDFWAEWCGPCQLLTPVMDELATAYAGKARIGKLSIDEAPNTASRFGVQGIPTVILFQGGEPKQVLVGLRSKGSYAALLDEATARPAPHKT